MAIAFTLGFVSCSSDDENSGVNNEASKSLHLKIVQDSSSTRAVGGSQGVEKVKFTSGSLYLVDGGGAIKDIYTIGNSVTADKKINLSELVRSGSTLENISGSVTKVYVVGNSLNLPSNPTNIRQVEQAALSVDNQRDINSVNLFGSGSLVKQTEGKFTAQLNLVPTVARIELTDLEVKGDYITGFKLDGVFIDHYYSEGSVGGALNVGKLVDNGTDATRFVNNSQEYPNVLFWYRI